MLAMMAEEALTDAGHAVAGPAATVAQAIACLAGEAVDFAIVDINLEGHNEGIALAAVLKETYGIPSMFLSAKVEVLAGEAPAALGFLPKPYVLDDLVLCVEGLHAVARGETPARPFPRALKLFTPGS
ncbi:response regulator receiver domain-containing protein [Pseudoduganella lurida]|uniref:Response regulator receiver domain-containing protein n=2 Tax=Pseudoduganella lurida TaxID=1036180 RepID=A0A562RG68_9BURK|nr:response regulator receiver domain-containing protein [Pseudoduganella lurida]